VEVEDYTLKRIVDAESRLSAARNEFLAGGGILPQEAVEAFQRALEIRGVAQVVICPTDLEQLMAIRTRQEARFLDGGAENRNVRPRHPRPDQATAFVEPGDEVERIIAGVWEELLGITQVGTRDDFFASGGDSLLAIRVTARLKERFSVELAPTVLFEHSTVSQLSKLVIQALAEQLEREASPIVQRGAA
jgi:acyl carrier protein